MTYELWEIESSNVMASFEREDQALAAIVNRARQYGVHSVDSIALVRVDNPVVDEAGEEDADMVMLAAGADLLARANATEHPGVRSLTST
jgi:nucleotide-binding universal stress UspA family protein